MTPFVMTHSTRKHFLELKIPPPALFVIFAGAMWCVARITPEFSLGIPVRYIFANCFALAGTVISVLGFVAFGRARTTINPMKPESSSTLVKTGIYRLTRNPMYLGLLLLMMAWAIFLSNWLAFVFLPFFIFYMNRFQIKPEETALTSIFGQEFVAYKAKVRRWL
jgi:protein-S-isoprenylcysteine O-methyltransferase Ste14